MKNEYIPVLTIERAMQKSIDAGDMATANGLKMVADEVRDLYASYMNLVVENGKLDRQVLELNKRIARTPQRR